MTALRVVWFALLLSLAIASLVVIVQGGAEMRCDSVGIEQRCP